MNNKTDILIVKTLSLCLVLMLSTLGLVFISEKLENYRSLIKEIDATALVSEDYDYSRDITSLYDFKLKDSTDIFIMSNNKTLTLDEAWKIKSLVKKYANNNENYNIMLSLYSVESNFYADADSYLGAKYGRGLGQVSEIALEEYNRKNKTNIQPLELYDIETNIKVSCWIYQYYENLYDLGVEGTLMVYNKGYGGYNKDRTDVGYSEKILNNKIKLG